MNHKALAIAALLSAASAPALAAVAIQVDSGGGPVIVASDLGTTTSYAGSVPGFWSFSLTGVSGPTPSLLDSTTLDVSSLTGGPHSLVIDVSATGDDIAGAASLLSSFTANVLPAGWSAALETWASASDALFAFDDPLASHTFVGIGTYQHADPFVGDGSNSYTGRFTINATSQESASLLTLNVHQVREPASFALLGGALAVAGLALRRRRSPSCGV